MSETIRRVMLSRLIMKLRIPKTIVKKVNPTNSLEK
jgi:hypothetical protein